MKQKGAFVVATEKKERESEQDPLAVLHQIDNTESSPLERKAVYLILRLLDNIEEYYELKGQIQDVIAANEGKGIKIIDLLNVLIEGLLVEESVMGKIDIMP